MRVGKHQLCLLATMASPFSRLSVADPVVRSLVRHRLVAPHSLKDDGGMSGVTPAGLQALADAQEAGRLEQFIDPKFQCDRVRLYMSAISSPIDTENG